MRLPDPIELLATMRLGPEETVHRLLTGLILAAPTPGYGHPRQPTAVGAVFLRRLAQHAFGDAPDGTPAVVHEFELPRRYTGEPDYGCLWPDRLLLIELKVAASSHRDGQLLGYLDQARHHHPDRHIDLLSLTDSCTEPLDLVLPVRTRYAHVTWPSVVPLIRELWLDGDQPDERAWARHLIDGLHATGACTPVAKPTAGLTRTRREGRRAAAAPTAALSDMPHELVAACLKLAAATAQDSIPRALEAPGIDAPQLRTILAVLKQRVEVSPASGASLARAYQRRNRVDGVRRTTRCRDPLLPAVISYDGES